MRFPDGSAAGGPQLSVLEGERRLPLWIGVTGNIACGKSAVLAMLGEAGAETIDADGVYASLVTAGSPLLARIAERFGSAVVAGDGQLQRRVLAGIVFADSAALADLDQIVRPPVVAEILRRAESATAAVVAIDAIKLIESGLADRCDEVWVVTCRPETQLARLMARNRLDHESARRRIAAQAPVSAKLDRADRVIANDGPLAATREQVERALRTALEAAACRTEGGRSVVAAQRKG